MSLRSKRLLHVPLPLPLPFPEKSAREEHPLVEEEREMDQAWIQRLEFFTVEKMAKGILNLTKKIGQGQGHGQGHVKKRVCVFQSSLSHSMLKSI